MGKIGLVVNYNGHWDSTRFMGSSPFAVCVTTEVKHDELLEKIYRRAGVSRDRFELRLSTMANTKTGKKILPIMYDGDVEFVLINVERTPEIFVEVVERPVAVPREAALMNPASFSKDAEDTAGEGNGKEGVGNPKRDGGKPSECGTSDKKRKIMSEGESSGSYEAANGEEDEDGLNTGHPTRRYSRQKQNVSYSENKHEDDDFASNFQNGPHSWHGAATNVPKPPNMQFPGAHPSQNEDKTTFWTLCASCGIRYQYQRTHVNKVLRCQSCQQSFTAYDLGSRGISPGHPWNRSLNQNEVPNTSKVPSQSNGGNPSAIAQEKVDGGMKGKESVRMHKTDVSNGKEGVGKPKPDGGKPSECETSRNADKKRKIMLEGESSGSYESGNGDEDVDVDLAAQNFGLNTGHPTRRYSGQKQNFSYCERKIEDSDFVNPPKWSNGSKPSTASEEVVKELDPELLKHPDSEFSDFDKDRAESCFAVNQVWAIYDTCDGMPRYYARIKKVFLPGFKLQMTWLEPDPDDEGENDWRDVDLPVACGKFKNGSTEENEDILMFSHQVSFIRGAGRNPCLIYPKRGETWALFRDWDIKWSDNPEEHQPPYQYEFVEVLADFKADVGNGVAYLGKVKGFVGVFQRIAKNGVLSFNIAPGELYRFSHRIPSFRMTGKEGDGVPEGSFELDPASLPHDKSSDVGDHKMDNRKVDTELRGLCPRSSQVNVKSKMDSPMKNESDLNRENSERKNHNKVEAS